MISSKKPDDSVGEARKLDDFSQTPAQKAALGGGGEEGGGRTESKEGWGGPGAGRGPATHGGNSQGHGDRMPSDGEHGAATNPKTKPGERHDA